MTNIKTPAPVAALLLAIAFNAATAQGVPQDLPTITLQAGMHNIARQWLRRPSSARPG